MLELLPVSGSTLLARFYGPYEILAENCVTDYVVRTRDRKRQKSDVKMLKSYIRSGSSTESFTPKSHSAVDFPVGIACETSPTVEQHEADLDGMFRADTPLLSARLTISETLADLANFLAHLESEERQDVVELLK